MQNCYESLAFKNGTTNRETHLHLHQVQVRQVLPGNLNQLLELLLELGFYAVEARTCCVHILVIPCQHDQHGHLDAS